MTLADDINIISTFLSHNQIQLSPQTKPYDCIILCVSAIFNCASTLFTTLQTNPNLTPTLILCGGIGHSTPHLYAAVSSTRRYAHLGDEIDGLAEAKVMEIILDKCFQGDELRNQGLKVLIEGKSTNCGANAIETRKLIEREGLKTFKRVLVVQDPTMMLRTKMSFEKAFEGEDVVFEACPTFVPWVKMEEGGLGFDEEGMGIGTEELWEMDRFVGLVLGEVERLRDDENGYGPRGKGFIGHVDVSKEVEEAFMRVKDEVRGKR